MAIFFLFCFNFVNFFFENFKILFSNFETQSSNSAELPIHESERLEKAELIT